MDIFVVFNTMIQLFIILMLGYFIRKIKILDDYATKKLTTLVVQVSCPMLVISSVTGGAISGDKSQVLGVLLLGLLFNIIILPILAWIIVKVLRIPKGEKGIYQFMIIFANTNFMGFPVVESIFGTSAIFQMAIFNMPFNLLAFSYGVYLIANDTENEMKFDAKKLLNPGIICAILAMFIYLLNIQLPTIVNNTLSSVGGITTPLSMIILGSSLVDIPVKEIFEDKKIYILTIIRLVVMPVMAYYIMSFFVSDSLTLGIITLSCGMPIASMSVMLSTEYGGNVKSASIGVFMTTLASVVTIPLIAYLLLV